MTWKTSAINSNGQTITFNGKSPAVGSKTRLVADPAIEYSLDVLSATWGTTIVTEKVRQIYSNSVHASPASNIFTFHPSNDLFGDPIWDGSKADGSVDDNQLHSAPRVQTCIEGDTFTLNYDGSGLPPYTEPVDPPPPQGIYIVGASFWNNDVTIEVESMVSKSSGGMFVESASKQTFPSLPSYGTTSQLTITYGYLLPNKTYQYNCVSTWEGSSISMRVGPALPRLLIQWADYGGVEFTDQVGALISFDQTLTLDMNSIDQSSGWIDPWPNTQKTMNILYQWEGRPLELVVAAQGSGTIVLDPSVPVDPNRTKFFNSVDTRNGGETNIIAVVWGAMQGQTGPVKPEIFASIKEYGAFTPTNDYFGFDGFPNVEKTASVFFQYGVTGQVLCISAREGSTSKALLTTRSVDFGDPLQARRLLSNFDTQRMKGFSLKISRTQQYVGVRMGPLPQGGPAVGCLIVTSDPAKAAIFNFTRMNVDATRDFSALQVQLGQSDLMYLSEYPGFPCLVTDKGPISQVNYELPGISANTALILSLARQGMKNDPFVISPSATTDELEGALIYSKPINQSLMEFAWILNETSEVSSALMLNGNARILPCTVANFILLKDLLWDLPNLIVGADELSRALGTDRVVQGIIRWLDNLTAPIRASVANLISGLWVQLQACIGHGGGDSGEPGIRALWPIALQLMKDFYNSGALWSLYGFISKSLSWFDYLLIVGNLLKFAIMMGATTALIPAAPAVLYATQAVCWVVTTVQDVLSVIKACGPQNLPAAASEALARLMNTVRATISTSQAYMKLPLSQQTHVVHALLNPHYTRIYLTGEVAPPPQHLSASLNERMRLAGVSEDPAVHKFLSREYQLSNEAASVVAELRPQVEKSLEVTV